MYKVSRVVCCRLWHMHFHITIASTLNEMPVLTETVTVTVAISAANSSLDIARSHIRSSATAPCCEKPRDGSTSNPLRTYVVHHHPARPDTSAFNQRYDGRKFLA